MGHVLTAILDASRLKCKVEGGKTFNGKAEKSTCKTAVSSVALNVAAERKVWLTEGTNIFLLYASNYAMF